MLYIRQVEEIIKDTLLEHQLDINYEINNKLPAPMSYNVSTNTVNFNYLQINGYMSKIKVNEPEENIVKIILYHEIGYYLTFKKHKHDLRTLMYGEDEEIEELKSVIETNAWNYGRAFVPDHLLETYDLVREKDESLLQGLR
ncbi:hypothetical protein GLV98_13300 [Halobacillus litoralis]|uniref:IrrE N-terminal-like domain-containing protein n=1 Tax=Halobacillus litoralis TaxID=45668 RepID=A0A845EGZ0_9BACI|nr:hypothetical protein [Halobacillus litoralis]MYL50468.1 hypothetical protein [Halobacillus litoralis]